MNQMLPNEISTQEWLTTVQALVMLMDLIYPIYVLIIVLNPIWV